MRNLFKVIVPSLLAVLFIGGCGDDNSTNKNNENQTPNISSNKDVSKLVSEKRFFLTSVENGNIVVVKKGNDFF